MLKKFFSFMKTKFLSVLLLCFLSVALVLSGCGEKPLGNNPPTDAQVSSNGGMAVVKGDYLYFVNGFVDYSTLDPKYDNKMGKVTKSAIYRTKLVDGQIDKDEDGFLKNADRVVSKVVGFENGGFYIFDDYILYATPNMNYSSDGDKLIDRIEFHRINIDGTKDKLIYTTETAVSSLDWSMYKVGGSIYLVLYDNNKIVIVNVSSGNVVTKIENTTSYALLDSDIYNATASRNDYFQTHIIYTRNITSDDKVSTSEFKGNVVCAVDIATGESKTLDISIDRTYTVKHVKNNYVYYTFTTPSVNIECLYRQDLSDSVWGNDEKQITLTNYNSYYFVDFGNELIIADDGSNMYRLEGGANGTVTTLMASSREIVGIFGNYAYYVSEGILIRFSIVDGDTVETDEVKPQGGLSTTINNSNYIDFDGKNIYVYATYTAENGDTNLYLTYIDESFVIGEEPVQRFVGVFESGDLPAEPEQPTEPEYEGEEIEHIPHID